MSDASLYNELTKKQIYLEGVKANEHAKFNSTLLKIKRELSTLFGNLEYDNLSQLTKKKLDDFIATLRDKQNKIYSAYSRELINQIKTFANAAYKVDSKLLSDENGYGIEKAFDESESGQSLYGVAALKTQESRWSLLKNESIPATGMLLIPSITAFANSAAQQIELAVRKGYANKAGVKETLSVVVGTQSRNFADGELNKINNWNAGLIDTSFQHVSSVMTGGLGSLYYRLYQWMSVIDSRTTDICRGRNGNVYVFGEGPLPPAHNRCRSHVTLLSENKPIPTETYFGWIRRQSKATQDDILGKSKAARLRSGKMKYEDFSKFVDNRPLSIDDFVSKFI